MDRQLQEKMMLGSMICDPNICDDAASLLKASHFSNPLHQQIYNTAQSLRVNAAHVDAHSILSSMMVTDDQAVVEYVFGLDTMGDPPNWKLYADRIRAAARLEGIQTALKAAQVCVEVACLDNPDEAQRRVLALVNGAMASESEACVYTAFDAAKSAIEQFAKAHEGEDLGIMCDIKSVDDALGGFKANELYVFAGRPGMGKTTFAMNIAEAAARKTGVLFFSLEMGKQQIGSKVVSALGAVNTKPLRRGVADPGTIERAVQAAHSARDLKLKFVQDPYVQLSGIAARCRQEKAAGGELGMVIVDYLQLMTEKGENRAAEVGAISRGLKLLAVEMGVPVIALAQLNRKLESRENKRPIMSDLRDSGSIEQDADVIGFLYRESEYIDGADPTESELILGKFRMEGKCTVRLRFKGAESRFSEYHGTYRPYTREAM